MDNIPTLNADGLKTLEELKADGLDFSAYSSGGSNGRFTITSYIAKRGRRKVYGSYNYQTGKYDEKSI